MAVSDFYEILRREKTFNGVVGSWKRLVLLELDWIITYADTVGEDLSGSESPATDRLVLQLILKYLPQLP
jgi:hypothetical protein